MRDFCIFLFFISMGASFPVKAVDTCQAVHGFAAAMAAKSESSKVAILPSYARVLPYQGEIDFATADGKIYRHYMFKKPMTFLLEIDEKRPAAIGYNVFAQAIDHFIPLIYVNPRLIPAGGKRLPLDANQVYEKALGHYFLLDPSEKKLIRQDVHLRGVNHFGEAKGRSALSLVPPPLRGSFRKIVDRESAVFVELETDFLKAEVHSIHADVSRLFLDTYHSALQRAYRSQGNPNLSKAIKLLDSWVDFIRQGMSPRVYLVYDRAVWESMMSQLHQLMPALSEVQLDSYQRNRLLDAWAGFFFPVMGLMVTEPVPGHFEIGRRFNNAETDPVNILFSQGKSPLVGDSLQRTTHDFYSWILQDVPERATILVRAFTERHKTLFRRSGFAELTGLPTATLQILLENKKATERYWEVPESWLMQQNREDWLSRLRQP